MIRIKFQRDGKYISVIVFSFYTKPPTLSPPIIVFMIDNKMSICNCLQYGYNVFLIKYLKYGGELLKLGFTVTYIFQPLPKFVKISIWVIIDTVEY